MSVMLYKAGGDTKVWGRKLQTCTVSEQEIEHLLKDGWHSHPDSVPHEESADSVGCSDSKLDMGEVSDGYHTFNELYAHRVRLFSTLMRAFHERAWWSFQHSDGEQWEGWILAGIDTPEGAVTYHLPEAEIPYLPAGREVEFGKEWDGHTADDVLQRLLTLTLPEPEEAEKPKRGRKPKAATDEPDDQE